METGEAARQGIWPQSLLSHSETVSYLGPPELKWIGLRDITGWGSRLTLRLVHLGKQDLDKLE